MGIRGGQPVSPVDRLAVAAIGGLGAGQRGERCFAFFEEWKVWPARVGLPAGSGWNLRAEGGQALLHDRAARQQAAEAMGDTSLVHDFLEDTHHAAAFSKQRLAGVDVGVQGSPLGAVGADGCGVSSG